jgi:hypothetical protein
MEPIYHLAFVDSLACPAAILSFLCHPEVFASLHLSDVAVVSTAQTGEKVTLFLETA